jgi:hypothetical protein
VKRKPETPISKFAFQIQLVTRHGGGFGGAVNTQAAYQNREKARDALYAQLRALAAVGLCTLNQVDP